MLLIFYNRAAVLVLVEGSVSLTQTALFLQNIVHPNCTRTGKIEGELGCKGKSAIVPGTIGRAFLNALDVTGVGIGELVSGNGLGSAGADASLIVDCRECGGAENAGTGGKCGLFFHKKHRPFRKP